VASFVESATLKVNDQSSSAIKKINAELKKLFATMKSAKSAKFDIAANAKGISKVEAELRRLKATMAGLKSKRPSGQQRSGTEFSYGL
jgi:hypothetical protein